MMPSQPLCLPRKKSREGEKKAEEEAEEEVRRREWMIVAGI
jgi:hypothetical protein